VNRLLLGRIAHRLDSVIALAVVGGEPAPGHFVQQMRLDQRPAEHGQSLKVV
jgi:hypothetical protein